MFRALLKKLISWLKELWSLFEVIDEIVPTKSHSSSNVIPLNKASPQRSIWVDDIDPMPEVVSHRYVELEGYAESLHIDRRGRYDLNQIALFAENFVWISPDAIDEFIDNSMDYVRSFIKGKPVLWLSKDDCIEWAYHQYSALADLL